MLNTAPIIDANINRVAEGLRVIEEYCRFIAGNKSLTDQLATLRKTVAQTESAETRISHLNARETASDMRAKETPPQRKNLHDLLTANFKRVNEGLRVLEEYTGNAIYNQCRYDCYDLEKTILLTLLKPIIKPGIYLISHDPEILIKGLKWGVSLIQLRAKDETKETIYNKAQSLIQPAKDAGIPFIINDYLDIAKSLNADGLHTGQDDIPISDQRQLLGPHKLIGRTTHDLEQGLIAQSDGADYVSVGPIWDTPSKPNRPGIGMDYLQAASTELHIPYVAIGGINHSTIDQVIPLSPPLIGLIRDYDRIPEMQTKLTTQN
ncbi:thiamine phosphate synthase [bacterium]|jgi:thiamine-phosphate pyrophosphorylase|nr:thiamine phosphate synthase [bacterium]